jgi:hypothetical protein
MSPVYYQVHSDSKINIQNAFVYSFARMPSCDMQGVPIWGEY